jgi:7,8-dihydroneopterin aldolase/epimerase/oxygenase
VDRIRLSGVRAFGRHGVGAAERASAQPFDIDVVVEIDLAAAGRSDDVGDTLDYAGLHDRLVAVVTGTSHALLEKLASELLDAVFDDRRVRHAEVTVAKPSVLDGATPSVTLVRANPHRDPS